MHGVTGVWSMLAVGIFSEQISHEKISAGLFQNGNARLLGVQLLSCVCMAAWATATTLIEVSFSLKMTKTHFSRRNNSLLRV